MWKELLGFGMAGIWVLPLPLTNIILDQSHTISDSVFLSVEGAYTSFHIFLELSWTAQANVVNK